MKEYSVPDIENMLSPQDWEYKQWNKIEGQNREKDQRLESLPKVISLPYKDWGTDKIEIIYIDRHPSIKLFDALRTAEIKITSNSFSVWWKKTEPEWNNISFTFSVWEDWNTIEVTVNETLWKEWSGNIGGKITTNIIKEWRIIWEKVLVDRLR